MLGWRSRQNIAPFGVRLLRSHAFASLGPTTAASSPLGGAWVSPHPTQSALHFNDLRSDRLLLARPIHQRFAQA